MKCHCPACNHQDNHDPFCTDSHHAHQGAFKVEQAVDMESEVFVASRFTAVRAAISQPLQKPWRRRANNATHAGRAPKRVVADAGCHNDKKLENLDANGYKSYIAVPRTKRVFIHTIQGNDARGIALSSYDERTGQLSTTRRAAPTPNWHLSCSVGFP